MKSIVYKKWQEVNEKEYDYIVYSDGSANNLTNRMGGWAYIVLKNGEKVFEESGGDNDTTNNRMELTAILLACYNLETDKKICVYTDSQYAIGVLSQRQYATANKDLVNKFIDVQRCMRWTVDFKWIKGHSGNKWNEYVDKLANAEYEKLSGEKQIDWNNKNQIYELVQKKREIDIKAYEDYIMNSLKELYSSDDVQAIFNSVDSSEIINKIAGTFYSLQYSKCKSCKTKKY